MTIRIINAPTPLPPPVIDVTPTPQPEPAVDFQGHRFDEKGDPILRRNRELGGLPKPEPGPDLFPIFKPTY